MQSAANLTRDILPQCSQVLRLFKESTYSRGARSTSSRVRHHPRVPYQFDVMELTTYCRESMISTGVCNPDRCVDTHIEEVFSCDPGPAPRCDGRSCSRTSLLTFCSRPQLHVHAHDVHPEGATQIPSPGPGSAKRKLRIPIFRVHIDQPSPDGNSYPTA